MLGRQPINPPESCASPAVAAPAKTSARPLTMAATICSVQLSAEMAAACSGSILPWMVPGLKPSPPPHKPHTMPNHSPNRSSGWEWLYWRNLPSSGYSSSTSASPGQSHPLPGLRRQNRHRFRRCAGRRRI